MVIRGADRERFLKRSRDMVRLVVGWVGLGLFFGGLVSPAEGQQPLEIPATLLNIVETVNVPASQEGILRSLAVREGSVVNADDLLAEIDSKRVALDLEEAQAQLEISRRRGENDVDIRYAQKSFEVAKAELDRAAHANSLVPGAVSASEIDHLQLIVEKSRLEIEQARHNFEIAKLSEHLDQLKVQQRELAKTQHTIRAPISGMVVALNFRAGEWVRVSDPVARIVRIDRLRIDDFVPLELGMAGLEDARVTFHPDLRALQGAAAGAGAGAGAGAEFEGRIVFVHPEVNPVKAQLRIWAEIDNRDLRLRPGLQGRLTIHLPAKENGKRP